MMVDHTEKDEGEEVLKLDGQIKHLKKTLTDAEILSQAVLFMSAGADTTATALSWLAYNLAMNPEIQDKLCEEIDSVLEKHVEKKNFFLSLIPLLHIHIAYFFYD